MREENYNNQTLIQYLLGSLPGEQVELYDELSIADDKFAKSLDAAEDDLVDAYVRGELTGSDLANFRSSYLTSPDKYEKVRFAQSLQTFCDRSAVNSQVSVKPPGEGVRDKFYLPNIFNLPRVLQWGFAAAMVLLIAFAWLAYHRLVVRQHSEGGAGTEVTKSTEKRNETAATAGQSPTHSEERGALGREVSEGSKEKKELTKTEQTAKNRKPSQPGEVSIASIVLTPQMRGIGQFPTFPLPAKAGVAAVQLQLEPNDYSTYRVELQNESSQVLWRSNKVRANARTLKINFPAKLLTPQVFVLQVYGVDTNKSEPLGAYPFKVVR